MGVRKLPGVLAVAVLAAALQTGCLPRHKRLHVSEEPAPASTRDAFEQLAGGGPSETTLLSDNGEAWAARWRLLREAKDRIDVTYFIVGQDVFGMAFLGALYKKALAGVKVQVLVDGRGSEEMIRPLGGKDHLQELVATGLVDVRIYNPPYAQIATSLIEANALPTLTGTHNKILVIDGKKAITGGRNIAAQYFANEKEDPDGFSDSDILVTGAAVADIAAVMNADLQIGSREDIEPDPINLVPRRAELIIVADAMQAWLEGTVPLEPEADAALALEAAGLASFKKLPERSVRDAVRHHLQKLAHMRSLHGSLNRPLPPAKRTDIRVVGAPSVMQGERDSAGDALIMAIRSAQHSIALESPYFVLTPGVLDAFEDAAKRGVAIDVITNSALSTDNPPSQSLFFDTWPELLARIPTMRVFVKDQRPTLHAKRAVFDDELTLIGSYNIDPLSSYINSELIVGVWSRELNEQTREEMRARLTSGKMLEYTIQRIDEQQARRYPLGHRDAGRVMVSFGPRDHVPDEQISELLATKDVLIGLRDAWGVQFVVY